MLDAGGAAPVLPEAREAWLAAVDDGWADPRRLHREGRRARLLLDGAREAVAAVVGARPDEVFFPPDHVRACHAAIVGCALPGRRRRVVTAVEHSAVLHAAAAGAEPATVGVDRMGRLDLDDFARQLPEAAVACVQQANGELGTSQPVAAALERARAAGVPLVVDAAAALGQVPPPPDYDVLVGSPRAWGSVPGVGLLVVRRVRWRPHEPGEAASARRLPGEAAGEVDIPAALAAAVSLAACRAADENPDRAVDRRALVARVRRAAAAVPDVDVAGDPEDRLPHVVTFSALYCPGEELVRRFDAEGYAVASGSACTTDTLRPSHVLAAAGALTHGNVRLTLPRGTAEADVEAFCALLAPVVRGVRDELGAGEL